MSRPKSPQSDAERVLERVGWPKVLEHLADYARTFGLARKGAKRAGVTEADDPVQRFMVRCCAGEVECDLPDDAPDSRRLAWARSGVRWTYMTMRREDGRTFADDTLDELPDGGLDPLALLLRRHSVEETLRALEPDREASAFAKLMLAGHKRGEIKKALGLRDDTHAYVVYNRVRRTIAALRAGENDNREERASGPVPRGDHDDPQTSQERPRADGEPHRGAPRARRGPR